MKTLFPLTWRPICLPHNQCLNLGPTRHIGQARNVPVQEELERLESGRAAGPSGHQHAAPESSTDGIAAAALVYFRRLGHLASCAASLR